MRCPICGSDYIEILKSKNESSKTQEIEKLILKCNDCETVFRKTLTHDKPTNFRVIISEHEKSKKDFIQIYPDEMLSVGDILKVGEENVKITSLENKRGARVNKTQAFNLVTIWASSQDIPARFGISIDYHGRVLSKKVDVERDFIITIGDVVKIEDVYFRINSLKTIERKMRKGFAVASVIKRVYGKPLPHKVPYRYDLTSNIVKSSD
ncbi:MAG: HVO_0476 family zinc finger protein [Methanobacteriaceae archaeon]|nr:HVO_0476 family zinc finger protein [Methanobacteriaceae archaeon]